METKSICVTVIGRVQGVWFRDYTCKTARSLGLTGFVRNESDGSVYLEAEGPEDRLNELVKAVEKGSPLSRVDKVLIQDVPTDGKFTDFEIRYGR